MELHYQQTEKEKMYSFSSWSSVLKYTPICSDDRSVHIERRFNLARSSQPCSRKTDICSQRASTLFITPSLPLHRTHQECPVTESHTAPDPHKGHAEQSHPCLKMGSKVSGQLLLSNHKHFFKMICRLGMIKNKR